MFPMYLSKTQKAFHSHNHDTINQVINQVRIRSHLGPIIFVFFIDEFIDIFEFIKCARELLFADDNGRFAKNSTDLDYRALQRKQASNKSMVIINQ